MAQCRLIKLGNGDVECERCKKNYGNFQNRPIPAGLGRNCKELGAVKTFSRFAKSATKHVVSGAAKVPAATYKERLSICRDCEFYNTDNPKHPRCNECGCFLMVKASWATESCPLKKWVAVAQKEKKKPCNCGKKKSQNTS